MYWVNGIAQPRPSIEIILGTDISYRTLSYSGDNVGPQSVILLRNKNEISKIGNRFGIHFNIPIQNKLMFKTGIQYCNLGYKTKNRTGLKWGSEINAQGNWILDPSLPHEVQNRYSYHYTSIPFIINYQWKKNRLNPYVEGGIGTSIFLNSYTTIVTDINSYDSKETVTSGTFNKFNLALLLGFGFQYHLSDQFQCFGGPTFSYHLTPLVQAPIEEHLYRFGIECGVRSTLKFD